MVTSPAVASGRVYDTRGPDPDPDPDPDVPPTCFFGGLSDPLNSTRASFGGRSFVVVGLSGCASRSAGVCRADIAGLSVRLEHDDRNEPDELTIGGNIWPKVLELVPAPKLVK